MKKDSINRVIGGIDDDIVEMAENKTKASQKKVSWVKWGSIAAAFVLVLSAAFIVSGVLRQNSIVNPVIPSDNTSQTAENGNNQGGTKDPVDLQPQGAISIPAIQLPDTNSEVEMIGVVVYKGGIYQQAGSYYGEDAQRIEPLLGEYLGQAKGTLNEWSKQDDYAQELASTYTGPVYAVKGYDTSFRVCIKQYAEGNDGESVLWLQFLDRLNDITISKGQDIFEERLHLQGRITSIQWQSHDDWNSAGGNIQKAAVDQATWNSFLDEIDQGTFINTFVPEGSFYDDHPYCSIYKTPNQAHLILTMDDGTSVKLRLIEGGYVGYDALEWYFVQIPEDVFNAVYDVCGGTHLTDW